MLLLKLYINNIDNKHRYIDMYRYENLPYRYIDIYWYKNFPSMLHLRLLNIDIYVVKYRYRYIDACFLIDNIDTSILASLLYYETAKNLYIFFKEIR